MPIYGPTMVQQLLLRVPKLLLEAIRVAVFQLVTGESFAVTAEAAGSSPVVPAIHSESCATFGELAIHKKSLPLSRSLPAESLPRL